MQDPRAGQTLTMEVDPLVGEVIDTWPLGYEWPPKQVARSLSAGDRKATTLRAQSTEKRAARIDRPSSAWRQEAFVRLSRSQDLQREIRAGNGLGARRDRGGL